MWFDVVLFTLAATGATMAGTAVGSLTEKLAAEMPRLVDGDVGRLLLRDFDLRLLSGRDGDTEELRSLVDRV